VIRDLDEKVLYLAFMGPTIGSNAVHALPDIPGLFSRF
jgi:hypothetical protein